MNGSMGDLYNNKEQIKMDEQREYPFAFSIIMSVYNVEPWIREAVDSLIAQDFGFENIQLIMVDDGSTDGGNFRFFHCIAGLSFCTPGI